MQDFSFFFKVINENRSSIWNKISWNPDTKCMFCNVLILLNIGTNNTPFVVEKKVKFIIYITDAFKRCNGEWTKGAFDATKKFKKRTERHKK